MILEELARDANQQQITQIVALLREAYSEGVRRYLIYSDANYGAHLGRAIRSGADRFFIARPDDSDVPGAFAHFRILDDVLFLNNICVSARQRGEGIGAALLRYSVDALVAGASLEALELDVFSGNAGARNWYAGMGMLPKGENYWYRVSEGADMPRGQSRGETPVFEIEQDANGFSGVYLKQQRIATLINDRVFIMRDFERFGDCLGDMAAFLRGRGITDGCVVSDKAMESLPRVETAVRLSSPIRSLKI